MQTKNNQTNKNGISFEFMDSLNKLQNDKTLQSSVELLNSAKFRVEALIKSAKEKKRNLQSAIEMQKKDNSEKKIVNLVKDDVIKSSENIVDTQNVDTNKNNSNIIKEVEVKENETNEIMRENKDKQEMNTNTKKNNNEKSFNNNRNNFSGKTRELGENSSNRIRDQRNNENRSGEHRSFDSRNRNRNYENRSGDQNNTERRQFQPRGDRPSFNRNNKQVGNGQNGRMQNSNGYQNRKPNANFNNGKPNFNNKQTTQKVVFADTSIFDVNQKNKHTNSSSKKKQDNHRYDEGSKRKVMKMNGLSELDQADDEFFTGRKAKKKIKSQVKVQHVKIENAVITTEKVSIKTLSEKIGQTVASILKKLMLIGVSANINTDIDFPTAELVASEFNVTLEHKVEKSADEKLLAEVQAQENEGNDYTRSPVVTVMGHVDHGKTSLLDAIRSTHVTTGEAGGITQHIGAYQINYNGSPITFIDTPGHEAFSAMRARGASVTDVAILVVAADDGVMPQTKESIAQIKQAGVPMIVAINKIDKPEANPDRIKQQLAECDVMPEEWGGDTVMVNISARNNINIDKLLEMVLLVSEVSDLKCNINRSAIGTVIEAKLDKGKGPMANVLIQNGTLHVGDTIISGLAVGRVRAMMNDKGQRVKTAGPSMPVAVLGLDRVPNAGDKILAVDDQIAKQVVVDRKNKVQIEKQNSHTSMSAEELLKKMENKKPYNVVVKADVQGSFEALVHMLNAIENEELQVVCVHGGVGAVNENDVDMAIASNAHIIAFNTKTEVNAEAQAEQNGIKIDYYKVIYEVIDDVKKAIKALLTPVYEEKVVGHCEVRVLFKISRIGTVAGCYVLDGKIPKNAKIELKRGGETIIKTNIVTLQKDRQDVKEVMAGYECGIKLDGFDAIKELDIFEASILERVER